MNGNGAVTVRETLTLLRRWRAHLVAGERGLGRAVTWASIMRARTPAFEGFQGGELALLSLTTLHSLRSQLVASTLPAVVDEVISMGASAIAVAGLEDSSPTSADDASITQITTCGSRKSWPSWLARASIEASPA